MPTHGTPESAKAYYEAHREERIAYQKDYNRRLRKGNEWMKNLPTMREIQRELRRVEEGEARGWVTWVRNRASTTYVRVPIFSG